MTKYCNKEVTKFQSGSKAPCSVPFHFWLVFLTRTGHFVSDEDKNEKGATTDSVQQRRQYRRQNQESSSGANVLMLIYSSVPQTLNAIVLI